MMTYLAIVEKVRVLNIWMEKEKAMDYPFM
jgi:hypothetical protein